MALLEIENLVVEFETAIGPFRAVDGVSLSVDDARGAGDRRRIRVRQVGVDAGGDGPAAVDGQGHRRRACSFDGRDLLKLTPAERRKIIGKDMAMIFQEPMASLNPCFTVGFQIEEVLRFHMGMDRAAAPGARDRAAHAGRHSRAGRAAEARSRTRCRAASASA